MSQLNQLLWLTLGVTGASSAIGLISLYTLFTKGRKRYPPGPPQYPFVGNYPHMPVGWTGKHYAEVAKIYGPIVYFRVPGRQFIVLNELEDAVALFEKRGNLYSDRPHMHMAHELANRKVTILFTPYNERYKQYKRLTMSVTNMRATIARWPVITAEVHQVLARLLESPEDFREHIFRHAVAVTVKLVYGDTVSGVQDSPYPQWSKNMAYLTNTSSKPGRWLVDSFRWLAYIPDWFPGAEFKRVAKKWRADLDVFTSEPLRRAKKRMQDGTAQSCFVVDQLEEAGASLTPEREDHIKYAAAGMYSGGVDSPSSFITILLLCMTRFQDVQRKAHEELDRVVGNDRLPRMEDAPQLRYIESIIKEVHRIHPVVNLIPHATYTIPAGASIVANIWAFTRNEAMYPEPERFDPDRFLDERAENAVDPRQYTFGLGRRRCPGTVLTDAFVMLTVASILSVFNIERAHDEDGKEIIPDLKFDDGLTSHAQPFQCCIVPRSEAAAALVQQKTE
ncbi:cytochrome P450 [Exidia glandulosa HHB12029]|uniref:Cytochrome P450 n=1 Tax=Exidia glandulosa HHB12029 TaxID=1314781 RepID=A0A166ACR0_EXIGL|nr:cytochrome P450 [Exidia glandulosa HHB12029]